MKQTEIEELSNLADRIKQIVSGRTPKTVLTDEDEEGWYIYKDELGLHKHGQKEHVAVYNGAWIKGKRCIYNGIYEYRKATPEEIQTRLTKVAEGMGFKEGTICKWVGENIIVSYPLSYDEVLGLIDSNEYCLMDSNGQWATIVSQPKPHEMTKGKWYVLNEPAYGDWLFKFDNNQNGKIFASDSYALCDMENTGSAFMNPFTSTRNLTPEEEAKYAHLMQEKVTVGGHEVRVQGQTITIGAILYTNGAIKAMLGCSQILECKVTLHGETMTTEKLQKLIDLIDGK